MSFRPSALPGPFRIDRLVEFEGPFRSATHLFPLATDAEVRATPTWQDDRFYDRQRDLLVMAFHALLVRTPSHNIIVDTCLGNHKPRPMVPEWNERSGAFLEDLGARGNLEHDVRRIGARPEPAHAMSTGRRLEMLLIAIVDERVQIGHDLDDDVATAPAIAAIRPTELDELLAPE